MNGADGTRPVIVEVGVGGNVSLYPGMTYANFAVIPHYVDGFGRYGEGLITVNGRPDGEGEYIWPACNNKQGFEWFATATLAKRGKDATDLRPYTLLSAWASVVPGVRTTDFTPEEGGHPIYGADNLPTRGATRRSSACRRRSTRWPRSTSRSGRPPATRTRTAPSRCRRPCPATPATPRSPATSPCSTTTSPTPRWASPGPPGSTAPTGAVVASGSTTLTVPLGSRVTQPVSFTTPATGSRVYLQLSTTKSGSHRLHRRGRVLQPRRRRRNRARTGHLPHRQPQQRQAPRPSPATPPPTAPRPSSRAAPPPGRSAPRQDAYTLRYTASGKMLDVNASSSTPGLQLQQWSANGGTNQMWYLRPTGDGYYTIVSRSSGLAGRRLRRVDQRRGAGRAVDRQRRHQPAVAVRTRLTSGRGEGQVRPPVTDCRLSRRLGGTVCAPESAAIHARWGRATVPDRRQPDPLATRTCARPRALPDERGTTHRYPNRTGSTA